MTYASGEEPRIGDVVMWRNLHPESNLHEDCQIFVIEDISELGLSAHCGTTVWLSSPNEYELLSRDGEACRKECEDCYGIGVRNFFTAKRPPTCPTCYGKGWVPEA